MCGHTRDPIIYSEFHRNPFRGFGAPGGQNLAFPITLASRFYNSLYYCTSRDIIYGRIIHSNYLRVLVTNCLLPTHTVAFVCLFVCLFFFMISQHKAQLSLKDTCDALCQLRCCPIVVRIMQTDCISAWGAVSATATCYSTTCIVLYMHRCNILNYCTAIVEYIATMLACSAMRVINRLPYNQRSLWTYIFAKTKKHKCLGILQNTEAYILHASNICIWVESWS